MIGMKAIGDIRVEGQQHIRFCDADLGHEFFAKLQALDQLSIRVPQKRDSLGAQHVGGQLLLALANLRHLGSGFRRVARALVPRRRQDEVDDDPMPRHHQDHAGAVELDVVGMRDDA